MEAKKISRHDTLHQATLQSRVVVNDEREKSITGRSRKASRSNAMRQNSSLQNMTIISKELKRSFGCPKLVQVSPSVISASGGSVKRAWELSSDVKHSDSSISTATHKAD
ncbi:unnamed protein product [Hymenolepis diminuta]|uniref:Uncharacterized protein n=1 Tax=Hymenolepis diminuta TaxID=6216 RepID=A0A0R3SYK1_HYMDI|nr:unnamed protein product [Hymenolepis diminuta]